MPDDRVLNTLPHWTKFLWSLRQIEHPTPVLYEVDLTNYCNLQCPWCISAAQRQHHPLSMSSWRWRWILCKAAWHRVGITITGGGESTLHPQFTRFIDSLLPLLKSRRIPALGIVTNGARPEKLMYVLQKTQGFAAQHIPVWIRISINARDLSKEPALLAFLQHNPGMVGLSFVYKTPEEKALCEQNITLLKSLNATGKYYRLKSVHDFDHCFPAGYAQKCIGRHFHLIHEPDGNHPYCCMQRGQGTTPPPKCPTTCPWGQPTLDFIWDTGPFS